MPLHFAFDERGGYVVYDEEATLTEALVANAALDAIRDAAAEQRAASRLPHWLMPPPVRVIALSVKCDKP